MKHELQPLNEHAVNWPCILQCFIRTKTIVCLPLSPVTCSQNGLTEQHPPNQSQTGPLKGRLSWLCNVCILLSACLSLAVCLPKWSLSSCSLSTEGRCQTGQWYLPALAQTNKPVLRVNCSPITDPRPGHHTGKRLSHFICYHYY